MTQPATSIPAAPAAAPTAAAAPEALQTGTPAERVSVKTRGIPRFFSSRAAAATSAAPVAPTPAAKPTGAPSTQAASAAGQAAANEGAATAAAAQAAAAQAPATQAALSGAPAVEGASPAIATPEEPGYRLLARAARDRARLDAERAKVVETARSQAALLDRAKLIEQGSDAARKNPLAFLQRAFGVEPQAVLDALIGHQARTPAERAQADAAAHAQTLQQRIAELESATRKAAAEHAEREQAARIEAHLSTEIRPVIEAQGAYPYARHYAAATGEDLVRAVYTQQLAQWKATGKVPTPKEILDRVEARLSAHARTLPGAAPSAPTSSTSAPATTASAPARAPATARGIFRPGARKAYVVRTPNPQGR